MATHHRDSTGDESKCQQQQQQQQPQSISTMSGTNSTAPAKWNRAIPESGYIRLGSIRYGVKMTVSENGVCTPLKDGQQQQQQQQQPRAVSTGSDGTSATLGDDGASEVCCCLGASTSGQRQQPQQQASSAKCRSTSAATKTAQNRTQTSAPTSTSLAELLLLPQPPTQTLASPADQSSRTLCARRCSPPPPSPQATSPSIGGHLVIGSRESSPAPLTTCCHFATRNPPPFKPNPASPVAAASSSATASSLAATAAAATAAISSEQQARGVSATTTGPATTQQQHQHRRRIPTAKQLRHNSTATTTSQTPLLSASSPSSASASASSVAAEHQRLPPVRSISERFGASEFNYSSLRHSAESSCGADAFATVSQAPGFNADYHDYSNDCAGIERRSGDQRAAAAAPDCECVASSPVATPLSGRCGKAAAGHQHQHQRSHQVQRTSRCPECRCHHHRASGRCASVNNSRQPSVTPAAALIETCDGAGADGDTSAANNNSASCASHSPNCINRSATRAYQNHKAAQIFGNTIAASTCAPGHLATDAVVDCAASDADAVAVGVVTAFRQSVDREEPRSRHTVDPPARNEDHQPAGEADVEPNDKSDHHHHRGQRGHRKNNSHRKDDRKNAADELSSIDSSGAQFSPANRSSSSSAAGGHNSHLPTVAAVEVRKLVALLPTTSPAINSPGSAAISCRGSQHATAARSGIPKPSLSDRGNGNGNGAVDDDGVCGPKINSVTFKSCNNSNSNSNNNSDARDDARDFVVLRTAAAAVHRERLAQLARDDDSVDINIINTAPNCHDDDDAANDDADARTPAAAAAANDDADDDDADDDAAIGRHSIGAIGAIGIEQELASRGASRVQATGAAVDSGRRTRGRQFVAEEVFPKSVTYCGSAAAVAELATDGAANLPTMEKRRKNVDRWQRLRFGRRSANNAAADNANCSTNSTHSSGGGGGSTTNSSPAKNSTSNSAADPRKSAEKTERLKELTEMLKNPSNRAANAQTPPIPPPVPPPRKPRSPNPTTASNSGSLASLALEDLPASVAAGSSRLPTGPAPMTVELPRKSFQDSLKALSKSFRSSHQDVRLPHATANCTNELPVVHPNKFQPLPVDEEDTFTAPLPNVESRISLGGCPTAKHMPPHRSASFSQVDYSSGKYIRSALGALKASIMKHRETSVVDSANLTLPRKKEGREQALKPSAEVMDAEPADDSVSYIFLTDKPDRVINATSVSISPPDDVLDIEEDTSTAPPSPKRDSSPLVLVNASELMLDTLCEEEICHHPPHCEEEFLQTATTCLIPVPVYECVGRDWPCAEDEPEVWMNVNEDDRVKHIEEYNVNTERITSAEIRMELVADYLPVLTEDAEYGAEEETTDNQMLVPPSTDVQSTGDSASSLSAPNQPQHSTTSKHNKFERSNTWSCPPSEAAEQLPEISVTSGSSNEFDELTACSDETAKPVVVRHRLSTEYVEVRKRHSNEDKQQPFESSLESINPSPNEERNKRIDKSRRRKGIYIQWPDENVKSKHDSDGWSLAGGDSNSPIADATASIWSVLSGCGEADTNPLCLVENLAQLTCKSTATLAASNLLDSDRQSPLSARGSLEPTTPESEGSARLQWPKDTTSRQSLPNPDEKDTASAIPPPAPSIASATTPISATATPDVQHRTLQFLRSDSVSDTEFDKSTPRERCSQSPVPADTDLKRYSKRPLRGPYGQMLEAEMKKPTKLPYDEILEELNRPDNALKRKESDEFLRQRQLSRKNSAHLPVPTHIRASSTPVHMETTPKEVIVSNHRRFPSCIDSSTDLKKEFKKMSLDSSGGAIHKTPTPASLKQSSKKSASLETNMNAGASTSSASSKRSSSKDESKSAFTVHRSKDASSNSLKATPELLAQLLKGSSEKLVHEQVERHQQQQQPQQTQPQAPKRQQSPGEEVALPTAVLKCLLTYCKKTSIHRFFARTMSSSSSGGGGGGGGPFPVAYNAAAAAAAAAAKQTMNACQLDSSLASWRTPSSPPPTPSLSTASSANALQTVDGGGGGGGGESSASAEHEGLTRTEEIIMKIQVNERTHVVIELFNTESNYVEALLYLVEAYLQPLSAGGVYAGLLDKQTYDEIFFMIPELLKLHAGFLNELQQRLNSFSDTQTQVGCAFVECFSDSEVFDTYMTFLNNLERATTTLRIARKKQPQFQEFLEQTLQNHKGKQELYSLLIKPVQRFPGYELILERLLKYTDVEHPDHYGLAKACSLVHDLLVTLNCKKMEEFDREQREAVVREVESVIEGVSDLVNPDRQYLLFDLVTIVQASHTGRKDRGIFLFNDLLIVTSVKKRSGTARKTGTNLPEAIATTLETNKYKLIMKIPIDDLDIVRIKDVNLAKLEREIEFLSSDLKKLTEIAEVTGTLRCPHQALEDSARELQRDLQRQLNDRQVKDPQLNILDLSFHSATELLSWSVSFTKPEKRALWEQTLLEIKQKIAASLECPPAPEFLTSIPIRKTRAGLQFTCVAPTQTAPGAAGDVWVCNSDGYVGQVCVLSLGPEPSVTSCNSVCNARILCLQSVPPQSMQPGTKKLSSGGDELGSKSLPDLSTEAAAGEATKEAQMLTAAGGTAAAAGATGGQMVSSASTVQMAREAQQSTMWLGMEDGYVHVYNCTDNIRIKNTKIKIQHSSAVTDIIYMDDQIFLSLANGDLCAYTRVNDVWLTSQPAMITVGSVAEPVTQMLAVEHWLWCATHGTIKIVNTHNHSVETEVRVSDKAITNMVVCGDKVWLSVKNTALVECYHSSQLNMLHRVNIAPQVTKMLFACDEIIRQHKGACLRVTSMLACNNQIWIGTSAGVLLTVHTVENVTASVVDMPIVTGLPHGHTGHVRVLTAVPYTGPNEFASKDLSSRIVTSGKPPSTETSALDAGDKPAHLLVISGGDGYENFRPTGHMAANLSDSAGREDSTNHLLIWQA